MVREKDIKNFINENEWRYKMKWFCKLLTLFEKGIVEKIFPNSS